MARISARWLLRGGAAKLNLTPAELAVLLAMLDHVEGGITWCPQTHLVRDLGIARSTVQSAIGRLLELRALVEAEPGRQGRASRYRMGDIPTPQPARPAGRLVALNMPDSRGRFAG